MNKNNKTVSELIGTIVNNIRNYLSDFSSAKKHCPFIDNVLNKCDHLENPATSCNCVNCPLGNE